MSTHLYVKGNEDVVRRVVGFTAEDEGAVRAIERHFSDLFDNAPQELFTRLFSAQKAALACQPGMEIANRFGIGCLANVNLIADVLPKGDENGHGQSVDLAQAMEIVRYVAARSQDDPLRQQVCRRVVAALANGDLQGVYWA